MVGAGGRRASVVSRRPLDHASPQRLERRAQLRREERGFFPCCEVSAAVGLVEVGEAGIHHFDPASRGSPELAWERREADGDSDRPRRLVANRREQERAAASAVVAFKATGFGYFLEQSSRPQTIGYSLLDSPIGLAAWLLDHDTDSYSKFSSAFVDA